MQMKAALLKVGFVLEIARKDRRFFNDLSRNPFQTLQQSGIDLSPGETQALIDVVSGSRLSQYAAQLAPVVKTWDLLRKDFAFEKSELGSAKIEEGTRPPSPHAPTKIGKKRGRSKIRE